MPENEKTSQISCNHQRRNFLHKGCVMPLLVPFLLSGCSIFGEDESPEEEAARNDQDAATLNKLLELEFKTIAAYDLALDLRLLNPSATELAAEFQKDHVVHAEMLTATIRRFRGRPVRAKKFLEYTFPKRNLVLPQDVLLFLSKFEEDLSSHYVQTFAGLTDKETPEMMASILGVETQHAALWRYWLGEKPVPLSVIK